MEDLPTTQSRARREHRTMVSLQESLHEPLLLPDPDNESDDSPSEQRPSSDASPQRDVGWRQAHRNVTLTLLYTLFAFAGSSIWGNSVLSTYVYLLEDGKAQAVGYATGVMGVANIICSLPAGYSSDVHRRDVVLKFASVLRAIAIAVTMFAMFQGSYVYLLLGLAVWGASRGSANSALGAIFADSIRDGQRSHYFTQRTMLRTVGSTTGPIVSLCMFALLGDRWEIRDCSIVLMTGQLISVPAMLVLCFFDDDNIVHDEEERDALQQDHENVSIIATNESEVADGESTDEPSSTWCTICSLFQKRRVATLIASSDVIAGLASGLSVRYFPIFFVDNLKLGPVMVQLLYVVGPVLQTVFMKISQRLSRRFGRCRVTVIFRWVGNGFMLSMILAYCCGLPVWSVCVLYLVQSAFVKSTAALTKSQLMDSVPKAERGRWSSLESINTLGWSGSAVVGGLLVGALGILPLFATTACLQICSTIPLVTLFGLDREREETTERTNNRTLSTA